jgi:hypothetical protein
LVAVAVLAVGLAGCILFGGGCDDTHTCDHAKIELPALDPSLAGAVHFTISRADGLMEPVTCQWLAAGWSCTPTPDQTDSSSVTYRYSLVDETTTYRLLLVGPAGGTMIPIDQNAVTPGDACGCVSADFQIPDSAWMQVGAL